MRLQKYRNLLALFWAAPLLAIANGAVAIPAKKAAMPMDSHWRTFAKPLALGSREMLFFQRDGGDAVMWRMDWSSGEVTSSRLDLTLDKDERYTAILNREGLWLLGKKSLLIQPNGQQTIAKALTKYNEPVAIALDDGLIAVFENSAGGNGGGIEQLKLNINRKEIEVVKRGPLSYDGKRNYEGKPNQFGPYREPQYGHSVAKLQDGRILLLGGDVTSKLVSIITPQQGDAPWNITPVGPLPHPRTHAAVTVLADGRVAVTGVPDSHCYLDEVEVRSVDVYDPMINRWATLPLLPFTPCADSYGANKPDITMTPDGSLVVGGHLEPHVMVLRSDKASPTGFSSSWLVYGQFPLSRTGGVIQALSDKEVIVAGGVHNVAGFGGCCYATPGFDRISIAPQGEKFSRALTYVGAGAAQNGKRVFVAAGRRFGYTSSGQMRYSAYAELIDLQTGLVRQLPNMPFVSGGVKALWLDDDRVLVKGILASGDRGFSVDENLSSYIPKSSGALAIFNLKLNQWTNLMYINSLAESTLLVAQGNEALLLSPFGTLQRLNLESQQIQDIAQLLLSRQNSAARFLSPNTLIAAGGLATKERISEIDGDCTTDPGALCDDRYVGFGPMAPTTNYETLTFDKKSTNSIKSTLSQTVSASAKSEVAAIGSDGRIYLLASDADNEVQQLARSVRGRNHWQPMPMPTGGKLCKENCALLIAQDPRDPTRELLFFRQGSIDRMHNDDEVASESVSVWLWSEAKNTWELVLKSDGMKARAVPQPLADGAPGGKGEKVMSMGWHLDTPILWVVP